MSDQLTRDDLVLLMESYRNMITMHQTILDQTNKTIDKLNSISEKQDSVFSKQINEFDSINKKTEELKSNLIEKINIHEIRSINDHGKITNKIHIGWVGMVSIILALIGLGMTLLSIVDGLPFGK